MWVRGWSVDAFGHLRSTQVEGLVEGVNVLVGANESGKTSMLHFLRWVLFGFPNGNTHAVRKYRPDSGSFGGRIHVVHDDRAICVRRHYGDTQVALGAADGSAIPSTLWNEVVGTSGRELFETVFAITTDELQGFAELSTDEVREHIYAAGIVGRGPSAREVLRALDKRRSALVGSGRGAIRELHDELARSAEELHATRSVSQNLAQRRAELVGLRSEVDECDRRRCQLDADAMHVGDLIASWPSWNEACGLHAELAGLPDTVELPADPIGRLEATSAYLTNAADELAGTQEALDENAAALRGIETDDRLVDLGPRVLQLDRAHAVVTKQEADLIRLRSEVDALARELTDTLHDLGADWTAERVQSVDTSFPAMQRARGLAEGIERTRLATAGTRSRLEAAKKTDDELTREAAQLEARASALAARVGPIRDITAAQDAAQRLRTLIPEFEARCSTEFDHARWEAFARDARANNAATAIPTFVVPVLVAITIITVLIAGILLIRGELLGAMGLVSVCATAGWVAWTLARVRATATSTEIVDADHDGSRSAAHIESELQAMAAIAGFTKPPTPEAANRRCRELDDIATLQSELRNVNAHRELHTEELHIASTAHDDTTSAEAEARRSWDTWRSEAGLPSHLRPKDCAEFLARVRNARDVNRRHDETLQSLERTTQDVEGHNRAVLEIAARMGSDSTGATEPAEALRRLLTAVHADAENRQRITELEGHRPALERALQRATHKHEEARGALDALLASTHGDPERYREAAAHEATRARVTERLGQIDIELSTRFGTGEPLETARRELTTGDLAGWHQMSTGIESERSDAVALYEQALEDHRREQEDIRRAEASADVARLSLRVEALRSELREAMEDWTVATLAHKAIDDTLRRFETERQPEVVRSAADSFRRITDGRYTNIVPEESSLVVLDASGGRLDASQLSRGATEQLYLAMRFGLVRQYARSTPLPLVLDDVLVNADPERRRRLAEELHRVSSKVQVLLFTCHPTTAELLCETASSGKGPASIVEVSQ